MKRSYWIVMEWSGKNFGAYAPDVPGCMATAKTLAGIRNRFKSALESHLAWMQEDGDTLPEASQTITLDITEDPEFPNPRGYYVVVERLTVALPKKAKKLASGRKANAARELVAA